MQDNSKLAKFRSLAEKEQNEMGKLIFQKMAVEDYQSDHELEEPSVYVGTYAKYNGEWGIWGKWISLVKCGDYDTFMEVCHTLHADEEDPELMFQDYENFPERFYSESCMDEDTFDKIMEWYEMDDKEAYEAYLDATGDANVEHFRERYMGKWDSEEDFAEHIVSECYDLDKIMGSLASYFDYKAFARDLFIDDYYFDGTYVFHRC